MGWWDDVVSWPYSFVGDVEDFIVDRYDAATDVAWDYMEIVWNDLWLKVEPRVVDVEDWLQDAAHLGRTVAARSIPSLQMVWDFLGRVEDGTRYWAERAIPALTEYWNAIVAVSQTASDAWSTASTALQSIPSYIETAGDWVLDYGNLVQIQAGDAWDALYVAGTRIPANLAAALQTFLDDAAVYADSVFQDAVIYANGVFQDAKAYADGVLGDAKTYADGIYSSAKTYADGVLGSAQTYADDFLTRKREETLAWAEQNLIAILERAF